MAESISLSLIMATVGRTEEVRRFVDCLYREGNRPRELIIVDQNEDDRLCPIVAEARIAGLRVEHVRMDKRNLSAARNCGLALACGGIIGFPDDDCWYDAGVIERVSAAFEAEPQLGGVVTRWVEQDAVGREPHRITLDDLRRFRAVSTSSITLFMSRSLIQSIGGFDERLGVSAWFGSGEETDLLFRVLLTEAILRYRPDITVHHALCQYLGDCKQSRHRARGTGALYAIHRLPLAVIARGLLSPVASAVLPARWRGGVGIRERLSIAAGRLEGYIQWNRQHGRQG